MKKDTDIKKNYTIEHYPESEAYYPKYGDNYLKRDWQTGIVVEKEPLLFTWVDSYRKEDGAREIIKLHKEQFGKENIKTIKVD